MAVTQLDAIKATPFIVQNILSLFTVLPLAITAMGMTNTFNRLLQSRTLIWIGIVSYEVYLIHAFTLGFIRGNILESDLVSIVVFLIVTGAGAYILHVVLKKGIHRWLI